MSLQFLLGCAGSGKTWHAVQTCIEATRLENSPACFLLVPEQYTMKTQAEVVKQHPCHGTMGIDIVSFPRLAQRVFEEQSVPAPRLLDDTGKSLLLRKVTSENEKKLGMFRRNIGKPGFLQELKSTLSEFWQYRIDEKALQSWEEQAESRPLLQAKCRDLQLISHAFRDALAENTIPEEELLDVLCRLIPRSELLRGAVVVLDGFTGFTPNQCEVIAGLLSVGSRVVVTLTLGSGLAMRDVHGE